MSRMALLVSLVAVPVAASVVMSSVLVSTRRRLRLWFPSRLREGRRHQVQKQYEAALREYNEAIETSPHLAEAYVPARLALSDDGREIAGAG